MAGTILLTKFEFDTTAIQRAEQENKSLKASIIQLRNENSKATKAYKTGNMTLGKSAEIISKNEAELKKLGQQYQNNIKYINASFANEKKLNAELRKQITTIQGARNNIQQLTKARNGLDLSTAKGKKNLEDINRKIDQNNKFIKDNVSGLEKQKIGIGAYTEGIRTAMGNTRIFGVRIGAVTEKLGLIRAGLIAQATASKGTAVATGVLSKALRVLKIALISTGIGAIVVLLGTLISAFSSTQRGADTMSKALAPIKGAFKAIIGVVQKLGTDVFDMLSANFTIVKNTLLKGIDYIRLGWAKLTGSDEDVARVQNDIKKRVEETRIAQEKLNKSAKKFIEHIKGAGKAISDGAKAQQRIHELQVQIEKTENKLIVAREKIKNAIKEEELIAKDRTKSAHERNKAVEKALSLSMELQKEEQSILDKKIEQMKLEQSMNDTSREESKELQQLEAERIRKSQEQKTIELRFLGTKSTIEKELIAKNKKAQEDAIKNIKEQLNLYIQQNKTKSHSLEQELAYEEELKDRKINILKKELEAKKISNTQYETEVLGIRQEYLVKTTEIVQEHFKQQIEQERIKNDAILESGEILTNEQINQQQTRLEQLYENEKQIINAQFEDKKITQEEHNRQLSDLHSQYIIGKKQLDSDYIESNKIENELQKQQLQAENEAKILQLEEQGAMQFEIKQEQLEQDKILALAKNQEEYDAKNINEKTYQQKKHNINVFYKNKQEELEKEQINTQLSSISSSLGKMSKMLGEHTTAGKIASIAEATINTYLGASKALASLPPPASFIVAGTTIATGLMQVAKIASIDTTRKAPSKASKGIILDGKSHKQGGEVLYNKLGHPLVEAEGGEAIFVVNKNSTDLIKKVSMLNQIGGGVPLIPKFAKGGIVNTGQPVSSFLRNNAIQYNKYQNQEDRVIKVVNVAQDTLKIGNEDNTVENIATI